MQIRMGVLSQSPEGIRFSCAGNDVGLILGLGTVHRRRTPPISYLIPFRYLCIWLYNTGSEYEFIECTDRHLCVHTTVLLLCLLPLFLLLLLLLFLLLFLLLPLLLLLLLLLLQFLLLLLLLLLLQFLLLLLLLLLLQFLLQFLLLFLLLFLLFLQLFLLLLLSPLQFLLFLLWRRLQRWCRATVCARVMVVL